MSGISSFKRSSGTINDDGSRHVLTDIGNHWVVSCRNMVVDLVFETNTLESIIKNPITCSDCLKKLNTAEFGSGEIVFESEKGFAVFDHVKQNGENTFKIERVDGSFLYTNTFGIIYENLLEPTPQPVEVSPNQLKLF